ncbi:unnamed protein product [Lactuca saligna]|uniref:Uncharacterized protein n=1 Tax=Lactuca saligna TaxID=75948 RepID=A0AA36ELC8_LACSI|nr:unnamed protein product [Lactuca saligna]
MRLFTSHLIGENGGCGESAEGSRRRQPCFGLSYRSALPLIRRRRLFLVAIRTIIQAVIDAIHTNIRRSFSNRIYYPSRHIKTNMGKQGYIPCDRAYTNIQVQVKIKIWGLLSANEEQL